MQAGEREALLLARHCTMRPPPGATPPQSDLMSPPHADLITSNSSRGRIGRSARTAGAVAGAAVVAAAAGAAVAPFAAGAAAAGVSPPAALTAFSQPAESLALFVSRHCNAAAPPVGIPLQTFG